MGFGMGAGIELGTSVSDAPTGGFPAYLYGLPSADTLLIDDLLDFSNHELFPSASAATTVDRLDTHVLPPPEPSCTDAGSRDFNSGDGDDSSSDQLHPHASSTFADDLCVPCDEAAELEWLSQFVEDSFSDAPYPSCTAGHLLAPSADAKPRAGPSSAAGRGARRKRSRAFVVGITTHKGHNHHQLATTWSSLAPPLSSSYSTTSSSSSSDLPFPNPDSSGNDSSNSGSRRKKGGGVGGARRCTHCSSEKTPQWRTGPLGPKTLCNACGVRYKSGRLVPEYRPAASPSFVLTQHSNSHRKVMELRRQNDLLLRGHDNHPSSSAAAARPGVLFPPSTTARSPPPS